MRLCGTEFDDPREFPPPKRDYREFKEGARTFTKELWVCGYSAEPGGGVAMSRYCLTMNNRGVCTFDGRPVRDEAEKALVKSIFETVVPT